MFKSIFNKLLSTYLIIIIVIISILSIILSTAYNMHMFKDKEKELNFVAEKVQSTVNEYKKDNLSLKELNAYLNSMGYITDSSIYILKLNKQSLEKPSKLKEANEFMEGYLIDDLKKILDGKRVFRKNQYSKAFDTYVVFLGVPLKKDSQVIGSILIFSPVNHITGDITKMNFIIWSTSCLAIIISAVFIYINSIRISKPIKVIDAAAKRIASGQDTDDLEVMSEDEIGQLAVTFNYMKNKLIEIENMRRDFIASISHDLKTPLTSINGFIEAIIDGVIEPDEYDDSFKIIKEETSRLIEMTNDLLQLSKIESGVLKLFKEHHIVTHLLDSIVNNGLLGINDEKEVAFEINCSKDLKVYADKDRLKQILINLVNNSIKYSYDKVKITIDVSKKESYIEFRIKDNGIGIQSDKIKFIFDKFYRVDKSRYSKTGGTGLGLNIVKNLVNLHGGDIYAESEFGKGTEIIFTIPA